MSTSFFTNIEKDTENNSYYRRVIHTVPDYMQLVVMNIPSGDDIDMEVHPHTTQFIRVEEGYGVATLFLSQEKEKLTVDNVDIALGPGVALIVHPGIYHRIANATASPLKLYTIYTPPEHPDGLIQETHPTKEH